MRKISIFLLIAFAAILPNAIIAEDYVDAINNASIAKQGQRVIYEMNVGSFTNEGTFLSAAEHLAELKTLGVDIVWLMPIYPRGGGINSPYAAKNFRQVNPSYGTIADLKTFVEKAHLLKMLVWLDWVPNHTATDADWVTEHPEYYTHVGTELKHPNNYNDVYELNYQSQELKTAMNDCLKFWIDQADIDGYRCDYVSSTTIPSSYWQSTIPLIKGYKAGKTIEFLAESDLTWDNYLANSNVGFDYDYAWQFQSRLASFGTGTSSNTVKTACTTMLTESAKYSFGRMLYITNHDQNWNESKQTLTQKYGDNRYALTVLAHTLWGMPLIYNGQEYGGNQALNYFQDTKISRTSADKKMLNTLRTLNALKHDVVTLSDKSTHTWKTVTNSSSVLAFTRGDGNGQVLVVLNFGSSSVSATITALSSGEWSLWLDSKTIGQGTSRKSVSLSATHTFELEAKGYQVYVKGNYSEEDLPPVETYVPKLESEDEISLFFETPTEGTYNIWCWSGSKGGDAWSQNGSWPGDGMTLMGQTATGSYVYKYVVTKTTEEPASFIITRYEGNTEKARLYDGANFVNHGYYVEGQTTPTQIITALSGIEDVYYTDTDKEQPIYTITGQRVSRISSPGIYIQGGKKILVP